MKKGPVTQLKEEFEKVKAEAKANFENYLRAVAEFENFRKRKEKEFEEFRCYANENLMIELIPILENFERALAHANNDNENNLNNLKTGLEIVYRQLKATLAKFGLNEFSCLGQEFDPKTCEAVGFVETDEKPANTVIEQINKGYSYQNKVIQPARVIIAKPKENQRQAVKPEATENKEVNSDKGV
ncbi:MAG: nucleotide exchange factor GrpE [candidate division WOR-3 bacterium]